MIRTIMIFPQFENIEIIDNIREQNDPLAKLVKPHITVGKFTDVSELNKAYQDANKMQCSFCTIVDKISVEMIGENEESIIIVEKGLRW